MTEPATPDPVRGRATGAHGADRAPTLVHVWGGSEAIEGQIVGGTRESDGTWDLDGVFTVRTDDGELIKVHGWNCITEVL